jgi:hypothetical protein
MFIIGQLSIDNTMKARAKGEAVYRATSQESEAWLRELLLATHAATPKEDAPSQGKMLVTDDGIQSSPFDETFANM